MRKLPVGIALLTLAAATLVGCSAGGQTPSCARASSTATDQATLASVAGAVGAEPAVTVPTPFHTDSTQWVDAVAGVGTAIDADDQVVLLDVTVISGATGAPVSATAYDGDVRRALPLSQWTTSVPGLRPALECATEGSRVVVALAPADIAPAAALGIGADDSALAVVDVERVYLARADGADQFTESRGLPTVVRAADGRPGVIVPDAAPPSDLVVQVLKRGAGPVVGHDDAVRVHDTGLAWADRKVFHSTWGSAPETLLPSQVIPGFARAVEGQTVGSQVLVVIPPELGYGTAGQGTVAPGATLVFVIDILGVDAL